MNRVDNLVSGKDWKRTICGYVGDAGVTEKNVKSLRIVIVKSNRSVTTMTHACIIEPEVQAPEREE